jgi:uncharacterized protein YutE (UPF0331/DUF86 family)
VTRHVLALRRAVANLRRHSKVTAAQLLPDSDLRWTVERGTQICVQNVLDIATHIAAAAGRDAADYASAIDRLAELSVIPADFAAELRRLAGLRNVLVHAYLDLDVEVLARVAGERLGDLERFADLVESWIARN